MTLLGKTGRFRSRQPERVPGAQNGLQANAAKGLARFVQGVLGKARARVCKYVYDEYRAPAYTYSLTRGLRKNTPNFGTSPVDVCAWPFWATGTQSLSPEQTKKVAA